MALLGTFFLGLFIACASLIVQVFTSVIAELFFGISLDFQYSTTDTIIYVISLMLLASIIEESLRYIAIKKNVTKHVKNINSLFTYGILFGFGFATFEIILISLSYGLTNIPSILDILPIFSIHILLSIFLLFITKKDKSIEHDTPYIITAILLHTFSNFILYQLLMST